VMLEAIMFGHKEIIRLVELQEEIVKAGGQEKSEVKLFELDEELSKKIEAEASESLIAAIQVKEKHAREDAISKVKEDVLASYENEEDADILKQVKSVLDKMVKAEVRRLITKEKVRPDGRKIDEIRPLSS
ncbi:polyribonucleotide nucleotidyltransferase, partial [Planococcus sp. SIMBA_143]